ncbi:MAG: (2Fe-2S) ferredoxin domain-containing protein [Candidatus Gastranaerophilales bacterium]|nr:(2Fe-2S) ferredoxin domain-containing protein [Candidatus Gastranaerophilales bacterium]
MTLELKICMGSACFAKGNQENLGFIKEYIEENHLETEVELVGGLCENECSQGPRIIADGVTYTNVTKEKILEILKG